MRMSKQDTTLLTGEENTSVSMATTTEEEERELESVCEWCWCCTQRLMPSQRELGANYDVNASVIEMLMSRSTGGGKAQVQCQFDLHDLKFMLQPKKSATRKRGTLLN